MSCIGVFDSGVGGLSVLKALQRRLPHTGLLYVADSAHAPYGERSPDFVIERSRRIVEHLVAEGAIGVVVACNTATAAAVHALREAWPAVPIIGVEPGLRPAAAATRNGRVGVMATPGTLASEKFAALLRSQPAHVHFELRPCPGLARLIEGGDLDAPALVASIADHAAALREAEVDTVVLGCTHYSFVQRVIEAALGPGVRVIDTAEPVSRHAATLLAGLATHSASPPVRLQTTGDAAHLREIAVAWLSIPCCVEGTPRL
jgi:glutamate racemase